MSPDMLTLVAEVLAHDLAFESVPENDRRDLLSLSRNVRSDTRDEKDIAGVV